MRWYKIPVITDFKTSMLVKRNDEHGHGKRYKIHCKKIKQTTDEHWKRTNNYRFCKNSLREKN